MIEDYIYENYTIDFKDDYSTKKEAYYLIVNNKREIYLNNEKGIVPTKMDDLKFGEYDFLLYIGKYDQKDLFLLNVESDDNNFHSLFELYEINHRLYQIASKAVLIRDWYVNHQYCSRCGEKTVIDEKDMMLKCPECGQMHYPRIAPAVIVAINNNGKLLMAKHSYHTRIKYALIAGFVEPGESIEEAVQREVSEEIGIKIKNIQYVKSQSWPFPNSLMLGFTADYDSGEIKVDGEEILEARWFSKEEIQTPESDISISSWLIENFIRTH